ncbi:hypothetical protein BFR39_05220 [Brochothrix thermosphacta]|nr:hypothetical protein BFR39_05220 [Brochothrix thermosphacta]
MKFNYIQIKKIIYNASQKVRIKNLIFGGVFLLVKYNCEFKTQVVKAYIRGNDDFKNIAKTFVILPI